MKVQYCSDLHLEFPENRDYLEKHPIKPVGDILVLAGDIVPFAEMDRFDSYFYQWSEAFEQIYWVPGNHEYYQSDINARSGGLVEQIQSNVFLVNNSCVEVGEATFIFSTLWSSISPGNQWQIQQSIYDFHSIKNNGRFLNVEDFNALHQDSVRFIEDALISAKKKVVVTHHVPTFYQYPEKFKGDALNEAFCVELYDLIESSGAECWIYGHHHQAVPPFKIGDTEVITNQLGYVKYEEHHDFDSQLYFNINI